MRSRFHVCLGLLTVLATLGTRATHAAGLAQFDPCWRGQSGTTFQSWNFSTVPSSGPDEFGYYYGPQTDNPDPGSSNPYGTPQAVTVAEQVGIGWFGTDTSFSTTLSGIWDLGYGGGSVTLTIPGSTSPGLMRDIWIQLTECSVSDNTTLTNTVTVTGGTQIGTILRSTNEMHTFGYTWQVAQYQFRVPANGANTIVIAGGCQTCNGTGGGANAYVESVVVDTRVADYSTISPGGNLAVVTQSECQGLPLDPLSTYNWNLKDATGAAGTGFDVVSVTGTSNINVLATSGSKATINILSLNGGAAGPAANFNNNIAGTWAIATTAGGTVQNFDASKFALSATTAQFQNNLGGGVFGIALSGDSKSINLTFTPNHGPTASDAPHARGSGLTLKVKISDLLAGSTADADGDARALDAFDAVSSQGATVTSDGTYLYYEPVNNNADFFNYTVRDVRSSYRVGDAPRTATAKVTISVVNAGGIVQMIDTSGGGSVTVQCAGIPAYQYDLERSATVNFASPVVLLVTNAPANGKFSYTDATPPTPNAFYRLKQH